MLTRSVVLLLVVAQLLLSAVVVLLLLSHSHYGLLDSHPELHVIICDGLLLFGLPIETRPMPLEKKQPHDATRAKQPTI